MPVRTTPDQWIPRFSKRLRELWPMLDQDGAGDTARSLLGDGLGVEDPVEVAETHVAVWEQL